MNYIHLFRKMLIRWLSILFRKKVQNSPKDGVLDETGMQTLLSSTLHKADRVIEQLDALQDKLDQLSPEEQAWAEWYQALSELDRKIVMQCQASGLKVDQLNFDEIKNRLMHFQQNRS